MAVGAIHTAIGLQSLHGFIGENGGVRTVLAVGLPESPVDRLLCLPHIRVGRQSGNDSSARSLAITPPLGCHRWRTLLLVAPSTTAAKSSVMISPSSFSD